MRSILLRNVFKNTKAPWKQACWDKLRTSLLVSISTVGACMVSERVASYISFVGLLIALSVVPRIL